MSDAMIIKINLHQFAKVKLTDAGLKRLAEIEEKERKFIATTHRSLQDGCCYRDQLWRIMREFGDMLGLGLQPFGMAIEIEEPK